MGENPLNGKGLPLTRYGEGEEIVLTSYESMSLLSNIINARVMTLQKIMSALRENEIYLDSIQGKTDKLTATWQVLSNNLLSSDAVKVVIDGFNLALTTVNALVDALGLLPGLIAAIGTSWAKANKVGEECALLPQAV